MSDRPSWREVVRSAAQAAASAESVQEARSQAAATGSPQWREHDIPFNYRWEHVQAVVRLALRLADLTGADREIVEAAAWLHDVAKGRSENHAEAGAIAARQNRRGRRSHRQAQRAVGHQAGGALGRRAVGR